MQLVQLISYGQESCQQCDPGKYSDVDGMEYCKSCPAGYYSNLYGGTTCLPCNEGYYTDTTAQASCLPCKAGYFTNLNGTEESKMAVGKAQSSMGQSMCNDCSVGEYSSLPVSTIVYLVQVVNILM